MTDADLIRAADLAAYREYASRPGDGSHPDGFSPARCALEHAFFAGIAHARVSAEQAFERATCQSGPAYEWRERFKRLVDEMLRWSNLAAYNGVALDRARAAVEAEYHAAVAEMVGAKDRAVEWEARALAAEQQRDDWKRVADDLRLKIGEAADDAMTAVEQERDRLFSLCLAAEEALSEYTDTCEVLDCLRALQPDPKLRQPAEKGSSDEG